MFTTTLIFNYYTDTVICVWNAAKRCTTSFQGEVEYSLHQTKPTSWLSSRITWWPLLSSTEDWWVAIKYPVILQCNYYHLLVYYMPGTRSYKQPLDFLVWSHCYLELAYKAPPFYPEEFEVAATAILEELNMNREDITISNAKPIYWHLCNTMSS